MKTLHYNINDLSDSAKEFLRNGFCIDDDENTLCFSKEMILQKIYEDSGEDLDEIPEYVWSTLSLSNEVRAVLELHWKHNEDNEVVWSW